MQTPLSDHEAFITILRLTKARNSTSQMHLFFDQGHNSSTGTRYKSYSNMTNAEPGRYLNQHSVAGVCIHVMMVQHAGRPRPRGRGRRLRGCLQVVADHLPAAGVGRRESCQALRRQLRRLLWRQRLRGSRRPQWAKNLGPSCFLKFQHILPLIKRLKTEGPHK